MGSESWWRCSREVAGWPVTLEGNEQGLAVLRFGLLREENDRRPPDWMKNALRQLEEYFLSDRIEFDLPLALPEVSDFQRQVWDRCREIPFGQLASYGALARRISSVGAARAVGGALGRNPIPIVIPCHRVVGASGKLTGFSAGIRWKKRLLALENSRKTLWDWSCETAN